MTHQRLNRPFLVKEGPAFMKCKYLWISVGLMLSFFETSAFATSCSSASTFAALEALGSCTEGSGDITFSNFHTDVSSTNAPLITASVDNAGSTANPGLYGFTFNLTGLPATPSLIVEYDVTCNGCVINGALQSVVLTTPGGTGQFGIAGTSNPFSTSATFTPTFGATSFATNAGSYDGDDVNGDHYAESFQLDVDIAPLPTPEPTSLILLGSGLVALGLAGRKQIKNRAD
jgi:hypothetical protein